MAIRLSGATAIALRGSLMALMSDTDHWAGSALSKPVSPLPAVAQTVGFGLGRSKMLALSMGID
jgi:hypothetical protein